MGNNPNYVPVTAANAPKINLPSTGYKTESLLTNIVKTQAASYAKKEATKFASKSLDKALSKAVNGKLGKIGLNAGLGSSAVNKAVEGARSASDKLQGALGGKLSSVLGSGLGGAAAGLATNVMKNAATGAISKVQSLVGNKLGSAVSGVLGSSVGGLLGNTLGQLTDSASKNLAGAKIAVGFLETGPKDSSLVTDVYGVSDNGVLNDVGSKISGFAKDAFNDIRQSPSLVADLTSMVMSGGKNFSISKEGLADRVMGSLGGQSGLVRGLTDTLKSTIVNGVGLPEGIFDTAVAVIGGQAKRLSNVSSGREVYSLINNITRSDELQGFYDVGSESALMAGTMREAIALGLPEAVTVLVEKSKTSEVAYNALYANMLVAVEHSDLDTILMMVDHVGVNGFLAQVPNAVTLLLSSYKLPVGTTSENYDNEYEALVAVLDKLQPGWGRINRNGVWVNDLTFYAGVSEDGRKLLLREDEHVVATLIGASYGTRVNLIEELKTMYPLVPLDMPA